MLKLASSYNGPFCNLFSARHQKLLLPSNVDANGDMFGVVSFDIPFNPTQEIKWLIVEWL